MPGVILGAIELAVQGVTLPVLRKYVEGRGADYNNVLRIIRRGRYYQTTWRVEEGDGCLLLRINPDSVNMRSPAANIKPRQLDNCRDLTIYLSGSQGYLAKEEHWIHWTGGKHWTEYCGITHRCMSFCYMTNIKGLCSEKRENMIDWEHHTRTGMRIMLDSGAFMFRNYFEKGPMTKLKKHQLHEIIENYVAFYHKWQANIDFAATLDVFRNSQFIKKITDAIRHKYGVTLMPVYHGDLDFSYFEHYVKEGYPLIGLQLGLPKLTPKKRLALYQQCFDLAQKYGARIHGFGVTDLNLLFRLPYDTVDSTTWIREAVHGKILLPHTVREHHLITLGVGSVMRTEAERDKYLENIRPLLKKHGLDKLMTDEGLKGKIPGRLIFNAGLFGKFHQIFGDILSHRNSSITHKPLVS